MVRKTAPFEGTDNKAVIRQQWDRPVLARRKARLGQSLDYFGLPGPYIEDLLDWRDLLGTRTGVERLRPGREELEDREIHRQIHANVAKYKIQADFELLLGNVEDIIISGQDRNGARPLRSIGQTALNTAFHYNLVNLDFLGGMGNPTKDGGSKCSRSC